MVGCFAAKKERIDKEEAKEREAQEKFCKQKEEEEAAKKAAKPVAGAFEGNDLLTEAAEIHGDTVESTVVMAVPLVSEVTAQIHSSHRCWRLVSRGLKTEAETLTIAMH